MSDAILDACLEQDPESKVACETATKTNMVGARRRCRGPSAPGCRYFKSDALPDSVARLA